LIPVPRVYIYQYCVGLHIEGYDLAFEHRSGSAMVAWYRSSFARPASARVLQRSYGEDGTYIISDRRALPIAKRMDGWIDGTWESMTLEGRERSSILKFPEERKEKAVELSC
jgi:hypothetical protein